MNGIKIGLIFVLVVGLSPGICVASDQAAVAGQVRWFKAQERFLTMHYAVSHPKASVIILHGLNGGADDTRVIGPLGQSLAGQGYACLAVGLPKVKPALGKASAIERLHQGVALLAQADPKPPFLIAYGTGILWALEGLAQSKLQTAGIVLISADGITKAQRLAIQAFVLKTQLPILDIVAKKDLPRILEKAKERQGTGLKTKGYHSKVIDKADHYYVRQEERLSGEIAHWLNQQVA